MGKTKKTNAIRLLETQQVPYELIEYEAADGKIDGLSVAEKIGHPPKHVYKTLLTTAGAGKYFVCIIPVEKELNLKKVAKEVGEKKIDLLPVKDLLAITGYIRGGCSPMGMKKLFPTILDEEAINLPYIIVSGGKIGLQVKMTVEHLLLMTKGKTASVI